MVNAATGGLLNASLDSGVPVIFGVLTTDTMEQVGGVACLTNVGGHLRLTLPIPEVYCKFLCQDARACTCTQERVRCGIQSFCKAYLNNLIDVIHIRHAVFC